MIDRRAMQNELNAARRARQEAEAANSDVEDMIWELQHLRPGHQRIVVAIAGADQAPSA